MKTKKKGWISLHRKLLDNPISSKVNYLAVWIYILLSANRFDKDIIWNNKKTTIKKGSFITSIAKMAKHFGLSTGTVSYILDYLEVERMIERQSNYKFTVITVLNYEQYQLLESQSESKLKASKKQVETTNKVYKDYKVDKIRKLKNFQFDQKTQMYKLIDKNEK